MSKFLKVTSGDYKVSVQSGGKIILDTGVETGTVEITGNLNVLGNVTTVQSENLAIKDNIIVLNEGEQGNGVTLGEAGLRIERGNFDDMLWVFDETVQFNDPISQTIRSGAWTAKNVSTGATVGLKVNSISTAGGDLYLINSGTGVISVSGTTDYERQIFNYDPILGILGTLVNNEDDTIPNTRAVVDYVNFTLQNVFQPSIGDGNVNPTTVITSSIENTGVESFIDFRVDDTRVAQFFNNRLELNDIRIEGSTIQTTNSNTDLEISVPGTGAVVIRDILEIPSTPHLEDSLLEPTAPISGNKIYMKDPNYGDSGIYYVNSATGRDELISTNRSIVYSMIF